MDKSNTTSEHSLDKAPATTAESLAVQPPTQAMDNSNSNSKESSTNVVATTTENANEQEGPLSTNNYNYKVCYNVELQNTINGYMHFWEVTITKNNLYSTTKFALSTAKSTKEML